MKRKIYFPFLCKLHCRSMTHDYEAVHSATEAEEAGVFKNCDFLDQDKAAASSCADLARLRGGGSVASSSYSDMMRTNESLLASHMARVRGEAETEADTSNLVPSSTTHTSQVSEFSAQHFSPTR